MTDYIKRTDAVKIAEKYGLANGSALGRHTGLADCIASEILSLPAADVAPVRHGHWIGEGDGYADGELVFDVWHCSECDYCIDDGTDDPERLPKYCPGCGALMDGGEDRAVS
jgi:hypothetical protein